MKHPEFVLVVPDNIQPEPSNHGLLRVCVSFLKELLKFILFPSLVFVVWGSEVFRVRGLKVTLTFEISKVQMSLLTTKLGALATDK